MIWRHAIILTLVAVFSLAFVSAGLRHVKQQSEPRSARIPRDCIKPTYPPSVPRPFSVASYSPWRRLKSVLEETSHRIIQEFDVGPAVSPIHVIPCVSSEPVPSLRLASVPLRC